jgi:hypothetical protein
MSTALDATMAKIRQQRKTGRMSNPIELSESVMRAMPSDWDFEHRAVTLAIVVGILMDRLLRQEG